MLVARLLGSRWAWPIDAGRRLRDGRPLLGPHKTWRGLVAGTLAGASLAVALGSTAWLGAGFALLSLAADAAWSCVKRRLRVAPGRELWVADALLESLVPLVLLAGPLSIGVPEILAVAATFAVLDVATAAFRR